MTESLQKILFETLGILGKKNPCNQRKGNQSPKVCSAGFEAYMSVSALRKLPVFLILASKSSKLGSLSE